MRQYNRIFVTLKQERTEFSYNGRQALGRCIIESKDSSGKISIYVQDLKPQVMYKLYLVSCQGGQSGGVPIGTVNVDERGKCEAKWEFDAGNIGGTGLPIENFNVVAIIVPNKNDITSILTGFTSGAVMWRNNFKDLSQEKVTEPSVQEIKETTQSEQPVQKPSEPKSEKNGEKTLEAVHMAFKEIVNKFNDEMELLQNYSLDDTAPVEAEDVQATHAEPFGGKSGDMTWIHISLKELALLRRCHYMDVPFVVAGHRKHNHLLLGKHNEHEKFILGVPENYCADDEAEAAAIGFKFMTTDGGEVSEGCFGYWLLDI